MVIVKASNLYTDDIFNFICEKKKNTGVFSSKFCTKMKQNYLICPKIGVSCNFLEDLTYLIVI